MKTAVIGYPRVGALRELKFATEKYFNGDLTEKELQKAAKQLRKDHWDKQQSAGIDFISSNDFSLYDNVLDTAVLLNVIPKRYKALGLEESAEYFAMARGYQGEQGDVKALAMKKWFNTNYHYIVPEFEDETELLLVGEKPFKEFDEGKQEGVITKPVIIGPFTFLKLAKYTGEKKAEDFIEAITKAYAQILTRFQELSAEWVQFDEPALVTDLTEEDRALFVQLYQNILDQKGQVKVLLQTYFGDIRDIYQQVIDLAFDGIGLDFVEGKQNLTLLNNFGFPKDKTLFAGVVNGKNIWRNDYSVTLPVLDQLKSHCQSFVLSTSCSLLHVPYTLKNEQQITDRQKLYFSFAEEKLNELVELVDITKVENYFETDQFKENQEIFDRRDQFQNQAVQAKVKSLTEADFQRQPVFAERERIQREKYNLPLLPTTTIGSFPQTADVKKNRAQYKKGEISLEQYTAFNKKKIAECIALQEEIGLDILVHGEFERNDMVEYFGEHLAGFIFTQNAWVQSYGTRCVKPPIIWGDVSRIDAMTVDYSTYAQSLTNKPLKGMLTGPITILNWSFPREDIPLKDCVLQIALAIREEVLDLEKNGINHIQVDEAALREKLPLRKSDWYSEYLDWAIPAFRLVHSGVKPETQIHTHMCYSEFSDIIKDIDQMDADVITFEASRSDLSIVDVLRENQFKTQVGPGVYDIHSPRIPSVSEIKAVLTQILAKMPREKVWVNPDCGLKTRGNKEVIESLKNMVKAVEEVKKDGFE
ncbi:5-methyltetrahydropteroyltriglutamate--homocysteine S-methyltransferase [Amphibacillus sp. MSJ-3]|uniref:5-methyltetrahydropteroyltriglutamate-- homocysteine S-methyltransferase n=1 Tax=Amphibacillus sp. MSJ-3 TaxID=2841505 RepID=UPI001C0EAC68|nr:5-methyltetrahydropteroyltriglutamate--homocysteine S-methyltransferase [Amphibacillus sp. MSJ-3]MBU5593757.1 5-methyltetrahydropteroyltriglutamate--homocysteine S-methyltransferase [Amphibacillus sp. MSJ-3]